VITARLQRKDRWITKGIAMPGFNSDSATVYERFVEHAKTEKRVQSNFAIQDYDAELIGDPDRVHEPLIDWKRNTEWEENANTA
jgi:hypothetical protein